MALPQPLHIYRKDLIHLWPETLLVLILFVAFCFSAPSGWNGSQYAVFATIAAFLLKILMPISWFVLIARGIQDESLVGDRQFWTSRPYHWANLLAAKVLLILTCIYLPFFLMQCYLLKHAGLHPMLVLPALGHNLLLLTVVLIVPLAAMSAVTSTFPRVLLTFIGAVIYIAILLGIIAWVTFLQMDLPHLDWIVDAIFIVLPAIALLNQYKTRKTLISRVLLAVTPLLALLIILVTPSGALIAKSYPVATGTAAPTLTGVSDKLHPEGTPTGRLQTFRHQVEIALPVAVTGIPDDINYIVEGIRTSVSAPGVSFTSAFLKSPLPFSPRPVQLNGSRPIALITFSIPQEIFDKIHTAPADVHLQLAAEELKIDKPSTWHATLLPFSVPGNGICSFPSDDSEFAPTCRYPLKQPETSFVTAPLAAASCSQPAAPPVTGSANMGSRSGILDFDPVITVPMTFQTGDPNPDHNYVLCPGTALTFVEATSLPNTSLTFDQKQVILDPFATRISDRQGPRRANPRQAPQSEP